MNIEFDTERQSAIQQMQKIQGNIASSSRFASWLIAKGIAKDDAGAQKVLVGLVVINFIVTFFVIKTFIF